MNDELSARQRAISLRLAGRSVKHICSALGRTEAWFHKWWRRYLEAGPDGLYDLTRANHQVARRIPPELERTSRSIRRRLQAHATPATRYRLTGAAAIRAELRTLGVRPLPCERTIERVLERHGLTAPRVRLAPLLPRQEWPGPQARAANELHEADPVGPIYLKGRSQRCDIWVGKDVFDGPSACAWPLPGAWTRCWGSSASAGRTWAGPSRSSSTTPANWPAGDRAHDTCAGSS